MTGALQRYRVVAWIVGVLLIALFFVGIPLKYIGDVDEVSKYVGLVHGMGFYPLYLLLTFDLARRTHMPMRQTVLTMLSGTLPIVSFYAERRTTEWVLRQAAAESTTAA
jgi:integral membrane protein